MFAKSCVALGAVKAPKPGMVMARTRNEKVSKLVSKTSMSGRTTAAVTLSFLHGQSDGFGCFEGSLGHFASVGRQQDLSDLALSSEPDEVMETDEWDANAQQQTLCPKSETKVKQNVSAIRNTDDYTILPRGSYSIIGDW